MSDLTRLFPAALCVLLPVLSRATPVELSLDPGGGFMVSVSLSTGPSDSEWSAMSGSIQARIGLDAQGQLAKYVMTGGRLVHADTTLLVNVQPGIQARFSNTGVATLPLTGSGEGWFDAFTGLIDNTGHRLISNEGVSKAEILFSGFPVSTETRNLSTQPDNTPLTGTTSLVATTLADGGWWKRLKIDLAHGRTMTSTYPVTGVSFLPPGTTYDVDEAGGFTASGTAVFPGDDFIQWAVSQRNVVPESLVSRDPRTAQPLLVMYSLRAGAGAWQMPVVFDASLSQVRVALPGDGTRTPLRWESWTGNAGDPWVPLAGTPQASGIVPAGTAGEIVASLPGPQRGFIRAAVPQP